MSRTKIISLTLLVLLLVGCKPDKPADAAGSPSQTSTASAPAPAQASALQNHDAILKLPELTDANAASELLKPGARSFVVVYSSNESSAAQTAQLELIARESHNYTGAVVFYRLDQARYPTAWTDITNGRPWVNGPAFLLVNNDPQMIGTIVDVKNGVETPLHAMAADRLGAEIARFFKVRLPVAHIDVSNVDQIVAGSQLPTFIMAYRSKGPTNDVAEFQRFVYESQLYASRVNFVFVDLDQPDLSAKLGIKLPVQDDTYFVVYDPRTRNGSMVFDPKLSTKNMEAAIRMYFGPGHEPATVIN